jgi:TetR/AcrR family tetracycline transcriptional repressor
MNTVQAGRKRGARAEVPVTQDAIVDAAFRLIEDRGLEAFSMRSLANELGVFPATLYWHVGDRSRLLGLVEHRWIEQVVLPDDSTDWREWMIEVGRRYRAHAFAHPNVARLATIERARNVDSLLIPDAIVGKLIDLGFDEDLVHAYNAVMGAVRGFVLLELAPRSEPDAESDVEGDLRNLDADRFPHITSHFERLADQALSLRWSNGVDRPRDD